MATTPGPVVNPGFATSMSAPAIQPQITGLPQEDLGPTLRVAAWLLTGLSGAFVAARLYCKILRHRRIHVDDSVLIASWVALLATAICVTIQTLHGFGKHSYQNVGMTVGEFNLVAIVGLLSITFTICSICWSKMSWAITILRISEGPKKVCLWIAIVLLNVLFAASATYYWVNCAPIEKAWHPFVKGTCSPPQVGIVLSMVTSTYSGIMDLTLALLPWWILRSLHMRPEEKFGVAIAMSMGVFAGVAAFIKCAALPELGGADFGWTGVPLTFWGLAEPSVTIMAASLPMMRVLVQTVRNKQISQDDASEIELGGQLADRLEPPLPTTRQPQRGMA